MTTAKLAAATPRRWQQQIRADEHGADAKHAEGIDPRRVTVGSVPSRRNRNRGASNASPPLTRRHPGKHLAWRVASITTDFTSQNPWPARTVARAACPPSTFLTIPLLCQTFTATGSAMMIEKGASNLLGLGVALALRTLGQEANMEIASHSRVAHPDARRERPRAPDQPRARRHLPRQPGRRAAGGRRTRHRVRLQRHAGVPDHRQARLLVRLAGQEARPGPSRPGQPHHAPASAADPGDGLSRVELGRRQGVHRHRLLEDVAGGAHGARRDATHRPRAAPRGGVALASPRCVVRPARAAVLRPCRTRWR